MSVLFYSGFRISKILDYLANPTKSSSDFVEQPLRGKFCHCKIWVYPPSPETADFLSGEEGEEVIVTVVRLRRDCAKGLRRMNSCEAKCESTLAKQNHLKGPRALAFGAPSRILHVYRNCAEKRVYKISGLTPPKTQNLLEILCGGPSGGFCYCTIRVYKMVTLDAQRQIRV